MKKYFFTTITSVVLVIQFGCNKNEIKYGDFDLISNNNANLKVNFTSAYASNPDIQFKIDGKRVSNAIKTRTPFPGGGYNTGGGSTPDYLAVKTGSIAFTASVPQKGTEIDSILLFSTNLDLTGGSFSTLNISDTGASTSSLLVTDDRVSPDSGFVKYRFVNLMPNVPSIDLYNGTTLVASGIAYKSASNYFTLQLPASSAWSIRAAGSSTNLATYSSASTITNARSYTAFAQGYAGSTDATRKPYISFFLTK